MSSRHAAGSRLVSGANEWRKWEQAGIEPSIQELMADPIFELILKRDRLVIDDVWFAVEAARHGLEIRTAPSLTPAMPN
jgi:hypothetical protein